MLRLSHNDLTSISAFLLELYAQTDFVELPHTILDGLSRLIPCEHCAYNEINSKTNQALVLMRPSVPVVLELAPVLEAHLCEHPVLKHYRTGHEGKVCKITDFVSERQFHQMALHREFYRHTDTGNQMGCLLSEPGSDCDIALAINLKKGDFSERDRDVISFLRPHFNQARQNAIAFTEAGRRAQTLTEALDGMRCGLVSVNGGNRIAWLTPQATRLLGRYFPGPRASLSSLPEEIQNWMRSHRSTLSSRSANPNPMRPLRINQQNASLTVRFKPGLHDGGQLLLNEEQAPLTDEHALELGLTAREVEVLRWMVEGKSNPEIAVILSISPRTVHKHIEHILAKLGVESRHAAMRLVLRGRINY